MTWGLQPESRGGDETIGAEEGEGVHNCGGVKIGSRKQRTQKMGLDLATWSTWARYACPPARYVATWPRALRASSGRKEA